MSSAHPSYLQLTNPTLARDEVHVWHACLERMRRRVKSFWQILSPDERIRAERFHFSNGRETFVVVRGQLRTILASYLDVHASQLCFRYNAYGKPSLALEQNDRELCFNLSYSGGHALFAISNDQPLGVDVERIRTDLSYEQVMEHFFSPGEIAAIRALPPESQVRAFFSCWTRKEAYVKVQGEGLSFPLSEFDVSQTLLTSTAHLQAGDPLGRERLWLVQELIPSPGYIGAIVVQGVDCRIRPCQELTYLE